LYQQFCKNPVGVAGPCRPRVVEKSGLFVIQWTNLFKVFHQLEGRRRMINRRADDKGVVSVQIHTGCMSVVPLPLVMRSFKRIPPICGGRLF